MSSPAESAFMHAPELYLPANKRQLNEFCVILDGIKNRFAGDDTERDFFDLAVNAGTGISDYRSLYYSYKVLESAVQYAVTFSSALHIDDSWDEDVLKKIKAEIIEEDPYEDDELSDEEELEDIIGGYLQLATTLIIDKKDQTIEARRNVHLNVLDSDYDESLSKPVVHEDLPPEEDKQFVVPSCADLVLCVDGLRHSGLLSRGTRAYHGAPLTVPGIHSILSYK